MEKAGNWKHFGYTVGLLTTSDTNLPGTLEVDPPAPAKLSDDSSLAHILTATSREPLSQHHPAKLRFLTPETVRESTVLFYKCTGGWGLAGGLPEKCSLRLGVTADITDKCSLN